MRRGKLDKVGPKKTVELDLPQFELATPQVDTTDWRKESLRGYQLAGAEWLVSFPPGARGRLLADGLGTGKTRSALAALRLRFEANLMEHQCAIVFTTANATFDWVREAQKFWPELKTFRMGDWPKNQRVAESDEDFYARQHGEWQSMLRGQCGPSLIVGSYESAERIDEFITREEVLLDYVIIDEAHNIVNEKSARAQLLRSFVARSLATALLTGTPVKNLPHQLYNLLDLVARGAFGSFWKFAGKYFNIHVGEKGFGKTVGDLLDDQQLADDIAPYVMGREASQVMGQMPARQRLLKLVEAPGAERISPAKLHLFAESTGIEAACRGAVKYKLETAVQLAKDVAKPVVLYTYRREDADKLTKMLIKAKVSALTATGDSTTKQRDAVIEQWKSGAATALVCTLDAVKESATLTRADVMIFVDLSWVASTIMQCEGRIDPARQPEGQRRPVSYYYVVTKDGPDEVVAEALVHKIEQASGLGTSTSITDAFGQFLSPLDKRSKEGKITPEEMLADITARLTVRANRFADLGML